MSLDHFDDRRKALTRRQKEMAKAARVVGPKVRNVSMYDDNPDKKLELAKLLALNVKQPGAFGYFLSELRAVSPSGGARKIVNRGGVSDMLIRWSEKVKNLMEGWPLTEIAAEMGVSHRDDRVRQRVRYMAQACARAGFAAECFEGHFKVLTIIEVAIKRDRERAMIEGHIKSRSRKSKPLEVGGFEPSGKQQFAVKWWELPQFKALEGGEK